MHFLQGDAGALVSISTTLNIEDQREMVRIRERQRDTGVRVCILLLYMNISYKNINCLNGNERYKREHCPLPLPRGLRTLPKPNSEEAAGPGVKPRSVCLQNPTLLPTSSVTGRWGAPHTHPTPSTVCPHRAPCFTRVLIECSDSAIETGRSH